MLAKVLNDFLTPIRKNCCRSSSCVSACLCCASANRHSVLSCRRLPTRPTIALHSCAWQKPSQHSLLACAALPKRLVSSNARESCDSWLKTFCSAKIPSPFVTAFRFLRVRPKTEDRSHQTGKITFCVRGEVSPLLANVYLHYVFDLWVEAWRKKVARGDVIAVRYADDLVVGFQHRADAERFLSEFRDRLVRFGLELHPDKTRLIEFGRFAVRNLKQRGQGKPETFTFLGFTHFVETSRAAEPLTSGALRRRSEWLRSSMSSRQSFNTGSIIARMTSAHGFGRWCRAITNTMLCPVTPVSCASSGVAYADCGGAF